MEQDIIEKSKNVAGRAVMGQLTLGLLEAIVCRMSDIGNKVKTVTKYFIVINYVSDGEEKVLSFELTNISSNLDKVIKEIRRHIKVNNDIEL